MRVPISIDGEPPEMYALMFAGESIAEFVTSAELDTASGVLRLHMPSGGVVTVHTNVEES